MENFGEVRLKGNGIIVLPAVTRYTIVSDNYGREHERYDAYDGVEVHIQDEGRTIKVFPLRNEGY